jgi:hypothetical protein
MKKLILAGLVALGTWGVLSVPAPATAQPGGPCAGVRCMECPAGTVLAPTGSDCCRCKPI